MLTLIFIFLFIGVFGKMLGLAIRATWGITKLVVNLILLPFILIGMVIYGLAHIAVFALVIIGIVTLVKSLA